MVTQTVIEILKSDPAMSTLRHSSESYYGHPGAAVMRGGDEHERSDQP